MHQMVACMQVVLGTPPAIVVDFYLLVEMPSLQLGLESSCEQVER